MDCLSSVHTAFRGASTDCSKPARFSAFTRRHPSISSRIRIEKCSYFSTEITPWSIYWYVDILPASKYEFVIWSKWGSSSCSLKLSNRKSHGLYHLHIIYAFTIISLSMKLVMSIHASCWDVYGSAQSEPCSKKRAAFDSPINQRRNLGYPSAFFTDHQHRAPLWTHQSRASIFTSTACCL